MTGGIHKATEQGFHALLQAANARAAEGYTLVALCALGTSSIGVVYRYDGAPRDLTLNEPAAGLFV